MGPSSRHQSPDIVATLTSSRARLGSDIVTGTCDVFVSDSQLAKTCQSTNKKQRETGARYSLLCCTPADTKTEHACLTTKVMT